MSCLFLAFLHGQKHYPEESFCFMLHLKKKRREIKMLTTDRFFHGHDKQTAFFEGWYHKHQ
ncbi:hypothetical protein B4Y34_16530, partial [Listeria monocytogenes]|nr:hypothetical protein [Listeria monocytogenes]